MVYQISPCTVYSMSVSSLKFSRRCKDAACIVIVSFETTIPYLKGRSFMLTTTNNRGSQEITREGLSQEGEENVSHIRGPSHAGRIISLPRYISNDIDQSDTSPRDSRPQCSVVHHEFTTSTPKNHRHLAIRNPSSSFATKANHLNTLKSTHQ